MGDGDRDVERIDGRPRREGDLAQEGLCQGDGLTRLVEDGDVAEDVEPEGHRGGISGAAFVEHALGDEEFEAISPPPTPSSIAGERSG